MGKVCYTNWTITFFRYNTLKRIGISLSPAIFSLSRKQNNSVCLDQWIKNLITAFTPVHNSHDKTSQINITSRATLSRTRSQWCMQGTVKHLWRTFLQKYLTFSYSPFFAKPSIIDVWQSRKYASGYFIYRIPSGYFV